MRIRQPFIVIAFALIAASCGVSREVASDATPPTSGAATSSTLDGEGTSSSGDPAATTPTTAAAPATTAPDDEVAATIVFGDGSETEIDHRDINMVFGPTRDDQEFVDLAFQGQVPSDFLTSLITQEVWGRTLQHEIDLAGASVSDEDRADARSLLVNQLATILVEATDPTAEAERIYDTVPYLPFLASLQARQLALSAVMKAEAPAEERFPCVSHILVATEEEANQVLTDLEGGADFAALASERSTDPGSATQGGELGCTDPAAYVQEFADAVRGAEIGSYVGPVKSDFGYHVLIVTGEEADGDSLAVDKLRESLSASTITVDERLGTWDTSLQRVVVDS